MSAEAAAPASCDEFAIVECMGHRTLVGRISEIERFGMKFMHLEPIFQGEFLDPVLLSGSSIYQITPCSRDSAMLRAPKHDYDLPDSLRAVLPTKMLPAPERIDDDEDDGWPPEFISGEDE